MIDRTPSPEILRWRAACQEAQSAENRAWALFQELLPKGTVILVHGEWRATVVAIPMPIDGSVSCTPFEEDLERLSSWQRSEFDRCGRCDAAAGSYDIYGSTKKRK